MSKDVDQLAIIDEAVELLLDEDFPSPPTELDYKIPLYPDIVNEALYITLELRNMDPRLAARYPSRLRRGVELRIRSLGKEVLVAEKEESLNRQLQSLPEQPLYRLGVDPKV
jgi:hypothetical protein